MKVLMSTTKEMVGTRPDGREKGSKIVEVEATVYWVIESDENQAILYKVIIVLSLLGATSLAVELSIANPKLNVKG